MAVAAAAVVAAATATVAAGTVAAAGAVHSKQLRISENLNYCFNSSVKECEFLHSPILAESFGVYGPADCGVKPGWAMYFCRTSRIFNCKLCLFGKISLCATCRVREKVSNCVHLLIGSVVLLENCWSPARTETCRAPGTIA